MPAFAPRPTFNTWDRQQQIGIALDRPFTFGEAVGENFVQGILDSFGLGTVVRENMVPELADGRPYTRAGLGIRLRTQEELERTSLSRAITKEQYEASPNFRTDVPWEQGMTDERAAALASLYDKKKVREFFSQKQPIAMFLGQLGGQALDPVNYVPVFSDGVRAAAVARMGSITGRAMLSASEAAINTAAFGVATREARAKYGDNVSWEAMTTEIAMSAIIGGLFGAGVGVIARGADKRAMALNRVQPRLETLGNVMQARAAINDAVAGLVDNAEVRLNPNSVGVIERMADQVVERTSGLKALRDETAAVTGSRPGEVVISPSGTRVQVRPEVVEASTLIRATGALQVRDRTSATSDAQVEDIAINLDPARLMPNVDASQGSPLVGADNIVDSGNGRVMAIKRAYEAYPDKAEAYRAALIEAGYADAAGMQQPVLISRRVTDLSETARAQFNAEVNGPTTARLSAVELAAMDREALSDMVMQALDDAAPVTAASNRAFVQRFLASLPQNERSALLDRGGALNADGARRIENALVARAYGDQDVGVVRRFAEATDDNTRAIVGALSDVAGTWSKMRDAVKSQEISAEFDLTPELTQALRLLGRWREQAATEKRPVANVISEGLAQLDLLSGEVSPEAKTFIGMFYTNDGYTRAVGRDTLAARLRTVAESTIELGRPSLFGDTMIPTKGEVLTNAQREQADAFAADGLEPRAQEDSGAGEGRAPEGAGSAGGQGAGSIAAVMSDRFAAAGRPADEAAAAGQIVDAFYTTLAGRLGITPDELTRRFGLPDVVRGGELSPADMAQMGLDIYRDVGSARLQFDDEVQAQVFDLGERVAKANRVTSVRAFDDEAPAKLKISDADKAEAQRLFDEMRPFLDAGDEPLATVDDFVRLAVQHWGRAMEEGRGASGTREVSTLIYADQQRGWNQHVMRKIREEVLADQAAGRESRIKVKPKQLELFQVSREQAMRILNVKTEMPSAPEFSAAVRGTPGAEVTPDGLVIDLVRYQKPEQTGDESVRTGVFYLPAGSSNAKFYRKPVPGQPYGGSVEVRGKTLIKRPIFVKGATGGKAPEAAFDAIKGKGAFAKLEREIMSAISGPANIREELVYRVLDENGADGNMAWQIIQNSQKGNQLRYALQENIIAHAVRDAGYDAVLGYSKGRAGRGEFISEVFDVREVDYPVPGGGEARLHPSFEMNQSAPASRTDTPEFKAWFGDSKVVDAEGKPLVVYRGMTQAPDGGAFRVRREGGTFGDGIYLTADRATAEFWANPDEGNAPGVVFEVYVSIRNPAPEDVAARIEAEATVQRKSTIPMLEAMGYDGIIADGEIVAFRPEQIKSVNNRGTWDASDLRLLFQPAYHGTPHIFDRFRWDDTTRGKGEGAQAFGDGLYFAGSKEVAEYYRNALAGVGFKTKDGRVLSRGDADNAIAAAAKEAAPTLDENAAQGIAFNVSGRLAKGQPLVPEDGRLANAPADYRAGYEAAVLAVDGWTPEKAGRLYKVDIPHDDELMVWDKPLSEQPAKVREAIERMANNHPPEVSEAHWRNAIHDATYLERMEPNQNFGEALHMKFADLAWRLEQETGEPVNIKAQASKWIKDAGIPGHRFLDGNSRDGGEGSYNYVIYDDSRVNIVDFEQPGARGAISLDSRTIRLFDAADASTALHESAHWFLGMYRQIADAADAPAEVLADWAKVKGWWGENADAVASDANASGRAEGVTGDDVRAVLATGTSGDKAKDLAIDVGLHEQWARAFEAYLREGEAPSAGLRGIFEQFKRWLLDLYRSATDLNINLSDEMKGVFGRMLAGEVPDNTASIATGFPPPAVQAKVQRANEFVASQPARSLDDTYAVIGAYQDDLDVFGQAIARERGATWRNPGLKAKEGAAEKMVRKGYETTAELTDLVRGGFEVRTPGDADAIVDGLRQRYSDILDEGWRMTAVNYFDRKVLVRFDDGTIGEVQFWHPKMFDTKETRGHLLYEEARKLEAVDPTSPRLEALFAEQRALYAAALPSADPAWSPVINGLLGKSAAPGNATRNAASLMGSPESMISTREAEAQPLLDLGTNQPLPSTMAAGRPSQLNSDVSMGTPRRPLAAIDATEPAPDPVPDGLVEAEARVGKGEDIRQIAEVHGVKEDGSFVEQLELDQMREEGKLTPEDEAELEAAEQLYADADAWAKSLEVAGRCMV